MCFRNLVRGFRDLSCGVLDRVRRPFRDRTASDLPPLTYQPALDGLRAVAVLLVVGYHARLPGFERGDLGVDVFFVLSGFLITSLIVSEKAGTGSFSFRRFYTRRFVRLFPAYILVLLVCLVATAVRSYGGTSRGAVLSFLYVANWGAAVGQGLGLLRHTWSLSIEEQFYLVWPIAMLALIRLLRARSIALTLAIGALMMVSYGSALLLLNDASLTWISNATPTRSGMLLAGALLSVALGPWGITGSSPMRSRLVNVAGWSGLVALLGVAVLPMSVEWSLVGVVWPVVVIATSVTIAASVLVPNGLLARLLGASPLVAIGKRSYGIYLWHFPVFVIVDTEFGGLRSLGAWQILVAAILSVALAAASYRFVEQPLIARFRGPRRDQAAAVQSRTPFGTVLAPGQ